MALDERFIETKALQALREAKSWDFSQVLRMDKCRGFSKGISGLVERTQIQLEQRPRI